MWFDASRMERSKLMGGKARMRSSFKKHTRRYKEVIAPVVADALKKQTVVQISLSHER